MERIRVTDTIRRHLGALQQWRCALCNALLDARYEVDHRQGLADGGSNSLSNLQCLCANCHSRKTMWERLKREELVKERRTGRSRYFDPLSICYLGRPPTGPGVSKTADTTLPFRLAQSPS